MEKAKEPKSNIAVIAPEASIFHIFRIFSRLFICNVNGKPTVMLPRIIQCQRV
jgi:hypothetical protein